MREVRAVRAKDTSGSKLKLRKFAFDTGICAIDRSTEIEVRRDILRILQIAVPLSASISRQSRDEMRMRNRVQVRSDKFQEFIKDN